MRTIDSPPFARNEWRRFERGNLVGLQEAVQRGMRATGKCCLQMDKLATEGKEWADWIVDPADSEMQRQSLEDILLLSCRVDDAELAKALSLFRQKAHDVTFGSRTRTQLFDSMRGLSDAYDAVMEVIGEKLKTALRVVELGKLGAEARPLLMSFGTRDCVAYVVSGSSMSRNPHCI